MVRACSRADDADAAHDGALFPLTGAGTARKVMYTDLCHLTYGTRQPEGKLCIPTSTEMRYAGGMTELEKGPRAGAAAGARASASSSASRHYSRSGHQPHRHGPALRGSQVSKRTATSTSREGRPSPIPAPSSIPASWPRCSTAPTSRPASGSSPPSRCTRPGHRTSRHVPLHRGVRRTPRPQHPASGTRATTRRPSPRGSPKPPATRRRNPEQLASNSPCSSTAPRPEPGSSTPILPNRRRHRRRPHRQRRPRDSPRECKYTAG